MKSLVLLAIILLATFGAGTVDVLFPDVIPLRPYTGIFSSALTTPWMEYSGIYGQAQPQPLVTAFLHLALICLAIVGIWLMFSHPIPMPIPPMNLLGSRGSHSRANRRASGAGWKDTSQKQMLTAEEQFRVLMQIFGRPKMVIIYDKQKPDPVSDNRNHR